MAGSDLVSDAVAELYTGDPEAFIERRKELAARARSSGDRDAAKAIASLGKPTRSAWTVNKLVHADPNVPASLVELGDSLRAGEAALDGASIRELSRRRRELVESLVRRALAESGQRAPSAALRDEVAATFNAALADPDVAAQVAAGALTKAVNWAGFGPGIGTAPSPTSARDTSRPPQGTTARRGATARPDGAAPHDETAQRNDAAAHAAAAERDRERREALARAEQTVADAASAADAAAATEREITESVSFMQERLAREQQRLVAARRDARQAAAALARARQVLDRIRRQLSSQPGERGPGPR